MLPNSEPYAKPSQKSFSAWQNTILRNSGPWPAATITGSPAGFRTAESIAGLSFAPSFTLALTLRLLDDQLTSGWEYPLGIASSDQTTRYLGIEIGHSASGPFIRQRTRDGTSVNTDDTSYLPFNVDLRLALVWAAVDSRYGLVNGVIRPALTNTTNKTMTAISDGVIAVGVTGDNTPSYSQSLLVSDVQVWQSAWTAADALYDYENPGSFASNRVGTSLDINDLFLYWKFDEGEGLTVADSSGNGFTGTTASKADIWNNTISINPTRS